MMMGGQQQHFLPGQQQQQFVQSLSHHTQIPQQQMGQPGGGLNQHQLQQYLQQQQQQKAQQAAALAQQQKQAQQQALVQQALNSALPGMQQPQQFQQFPGMQQQQVAAAGLTNMLLGGQQAPPFMQQQQGQVPLDILALANKASQALSGLPQVNAPAMNMNPNFPPRPPAAAQSTFVGGTEQELPQMVQYAVQNLRTTGHIENVLDPPLCAMLRRLPEHAALSALEIFSSCDLAKMRNKGAYLSGILKKELIKQGL